MTFLIPDALRSHLAPGGYLEQAEINPALGSDDGSLSDKTPLGYGGSLAYKCGQLSGRSFDVQPHIKDWISKAGFINVVEQKFKWPIGDWPADSKMKDIGKWNATHWNLGIESWSIRLLTQTYGVCILFSSSRPI